MDVVFAWNDALRPTSPPGPARPRTHPQAPTPGSVGPAAREVIRWGFSRNTISITTPTLWTRHCGGRLAIHCHDLGRTHHYHTTRLTTSLDPVPLGSAGAHRADQCSQRTDCSTDRSPAHNVAAWRGVREHTSGARGVAVRRGASRQP